MEMREKMEMRKKFERIEKPKEMLPSKNLESYVNQVKVEEGDSKKLDYPLLSLTIRDVHQLKGLEAFILDKTKLAPYIGRTMNPWDRVKKGIKYSTNFGIVDLRGRVHNNGYSVTREANPDMEDSPEFAYNEVKIIKTNKGKAVIGIKSNRVLNFYKIDFRCNDDPFFRAEFEFIDGYNLDEENRDREKRNLLTKILQATNFEEKLQSSGQFLMRDLDKEKTRDPVCKIIKVYEEKCSENYKPLGLIAIETIDRRFDANPKDVHFYLLEPEMGCPERILTETLAYNKDYQNKQEFYSIRKIKTFPDEVFQDRDRKIKIPVKFEIVANWNRRWAPCEILAANNFNLEYQLKNT